MSFLAEYGIFLAKTATVVIAILAVIATLAALKAKAKAEEKGMLLIKKINEQYDETTESINDIILTKPEKKAQKKIEKEKHKKKEDSVKNRLFVLKFDGDIRASAICEFRREITAVLLTAKPSDRVLVKLESGGGMVNAYGLAASQLQRFRDAKIHLTVAIDKIAASGGYMMACVANEIIAAPFAIVGSIGVIAQLPNVHRLLQKNHVDFEQITAGQYKRTLTILGENTKEGRKKLQEEVNETHELFKNFIKNHRQQVSLEQVATGEHWFAEQAIEKALVDKLQTSDDYLLSHKDDFDMYEVQYKTKQPLAKRLGSSVQSAIDSVLVANKSTGQDYIH